MNNGMLSGGVQHPQNRCGAAKEVEPTVVGGDLLIGSGAGTEEVAQLVVGAAKICRPIVGSWTTSRGGRPFRRASQTGHARGCVSRGGQTRRRASRRGQHYRRRGPVGSIARQCPRQRRDTPSQRAAPASALGRFGCGCANRIILYSVKSRPVGPLVVEEPPPRASAPGIAAWAGGIGKIRYQ
jgi:hypothetical protein